MAVTPPRLWPVFVAYVLAFVSIVSFSLVAAVMPRTARRIVFTVLNFDDSVCDYQAEYIADIDGHLTVNPVTDAELVFCPASNLFEGRRFSMQSATVVEI